jgi:TPR repeat protein
MKRIASVVVFLIVAAALPAQTLDDALAAYQRGQFFVAAQAFTKLAEQGDAKAQFQLGLLYYTGKGVP